MPLQFVERELANDVSAGSVDDLCPEHFAVLAECLIDTRAGNTLRGGKLLELEGMEAFLEDREPDFM